jgi:uncharacterized damage-inducible protein DinB
VTTSSDPATVLAHGIAAEFRRRLLDEHLPRIGRCLELLGDERVWQRPPGPGNSVGNLVLHLCGNTTQWILANFGVEPDQRHRAAEFAADGGRTAAELHACLGAVYTRACATVAGLSVAELLRSRLVQGRYQETGLSSVLHVLEHCSGHAYQIYAWTKAMLGIDLRFYDL